MPRQISRHPGFAARRCSSPGPTRHRSLVRDYETLTSSVEAMIALDQATTRLLRAHLRQQTNERKATGGAWQDSGYVVTTADGSPLHADWLPRASTAL